MNEIVQPAVNPVKNFDELPINLKYQLMYEYYKQQVGSVNLLMGDGYLTPMDFPTWMVKKKEHWDWEPPKE